MICQDVVAAVLIVPVLGEENAVVGLLQGAPMMLLTAQVPCRDGEQVLPGLLIRVILGLRGQESSETIGSLSGTRTEDRRELEIHGQAAFKANTSVTPRGAGHGQ